VSVCGDRWIYIQRERERERQRQRQRQRVGACVDRGIGESRGGGRGERGRVE